MGSDRESNLDHIKVPLPDDYTPGSLVDLFLAGASRQDGGSLFRRDTDGEWQEVSRAAFVERVRALSLALQAHGYEPGDRVAILSNTRLEWALCDYGSLMAGLVVVTVYPTLPADQVAYILQNSGSVAVFAENEVQAEKLDAVRAELPDLREIILLEAPSAGVRPGESVVTLAELEAEGVREASRLEAEGRPGAYEARARSVKPTDLATLIYTSGTTGKPKGVMLSHSNLYSNAVFAQQALSLTPADRALSWLPLSHAFERTAGHFLFWYVGAEIAYAESPLTVARDLREIRPTIAIGVPRLYEKVYEAVEEAAEAGGAVKKLILAWAKRVGDRVTEVRQAGKDVPFGLDLAHKVADRLVFAKLRARAGGRIRAFVSGAAPLSPLIARFFYSAGLPVIEGYGLSETSPVTNVNPIDAIRFGTVGPPLQGTEIRIAADGEIQVRGAQVMMGYYGLPELTRDALTADGWFSTGDIGKMDADGYLTITDRKKNLIVTAAGKNIAPQPIEELIGRSSLVEQVVMLGDRRRFPFVIVVPSAQALRAATPGDEYSDPEGEELSGSARVQEIVENAVLGALDGLARFERPKKVLLANEPFSIENGTLTPTLKVKRRVVAAQYAEAIEAMYEQAEAEMDERDGADENDGADG
ncbi:MAG: long-chain fatty acid--CoA ligase [Gemmatimonadota bacterium]